MTTRNKYLMDGNTLYKIVGKYKNGFECVITPPLSQVHQQINTLKGYAEIIYDITTRDNQQKVKISNRIYNKFSFSDKYDEDEIIKYKFIFDTFIMDTLHEINYNCNNMILIN